MTSVPTEWRNAMARAIHGKPTRYPWEAGEAAQAALDAVIPMIDERILEQAQALWERQQPFTVTFTIDRVDPEAMATLIGACAHCRQITGHAPGCITLLADQLADPCGGNVKGGPGCTCNPAF